jgi:hypothetical protein
MASINCRNCNSKHSSVQEVRECYQGNATFSAKLETSPITEPQFRFLTTLRIERDIPLAGLEKLTLTAARTEISHLINDVPKIVRPVTPDEVFKASERTHSSISIPAGHYAVASLTGNNDLDFFRVDRPTEGRWAGRTYVKRVVGGKPDSKVFGKTGEQVLQAIWDAGIGDSAKLYGTELGQCSRCNRHLTDELSRSLGIGPDCRNK